MTKLVLAFAPSGNWQALNWADTIIVQLVMQQPQGQKQERVESFWKGCFCAAASWTLTGAAVEIHASPIDFHGPSVFDTTRKLLCSLGRQCKAIFKKRNKTKCFSWYPTLALNLLTLELQPYSTSQGHGYRIVKKKARASKWFTEKC